MSDRVLSLAVILALVGAVLAINSATESSREANRGREEALSAHRLRAVTCRLQVAEGPPWTHGSTWALVVAPVDGGAERGVIMWREGDDESAPWRIAEAPWIDATR